MKVIFNSVYTIQVTVFLFGYPCNIRIEFMSIILSDCWQAVLGPENNVIQMLTIA